MTVTSSISRATSVRRRRRVGRPAQEGLRVALGPDPAERGLDERCWLAANRIPLSRWMSAATWSSAVVTRPGERAERAQPPADLAERQDELGAALDRGPAACRRRRRSPRPGRSSARPRASTSAARRRRRGPFRSARRATASLPACAARLRSSTSPEGRWSARVGRVVEQHPAGGVQQRGGRRPARPRCPGSASAPVAADPHAAAAPRRRASGRSPSPKPAAMCWTTRIGIGERRRGPRRAPRRAPAARRSRRRSPIDRGGARPRPRRPAMHRPGPRADGGSPGRR